MYRNGGRGTFRPPSFLQRNDTDGSISEGPSAPVAQQTSHFLTPQKRKSSVNLSPSSSTHPEEDAINFSHSMSSRTTNEAAHTVSLRHSSGSRSNALGKHNGGNIDSPSHGTVGTGSRESDEYYMCTWRKPQGRKHKTWDGDAVLIVSRGQGSCKLKCQESGRELGFSNKLQADSISTGDEMVVGGKEIEIDRQISYREYLSGIPGQPSYPPKKVRAKQADSRAILAQSNPLAPSSSRNPGLLAAAPSASFYSKPLPRPRVKSTERVSPEQGYVLQEEVSKGSPSSSSSKRKDAPAPTHPRPHGLFTPDALPEPRYDPKAPGAIVLKRPDADHQKKYNRRNLPVVDVVVNPILAEALRPHQVEGVNFLYERVTGITDVNGQKGAILADEMGLGKTLQTIALIETLLRQSPYHSSKPCIIEKALVVCPLSLVKNWKKEFRKWLGPTTIGVVAVDGSKSKEITQRFVTSKRDQVLIIGYEKLRSCIEILATAQPQIGLIVCDEGHRLKSKETKTNKIFSQLTTSRRVILTGTPIQNDLSELYAMIDFVCPGLLGTYTSFKAIFEDPILKSRVQHCSKEVRDLGSQRSLTLSTVTQLVVIRRTADILDGFLLPKNETILFCSPSKLQLDLYRRVLKSTEVRTLTSGGAGGSALPLITMLRQICDSPELLLKEGIASDGANRTLASDLLHDSRHLFPSRKVTGDETLSGKMTVIARMLKQIKEKTDDKVVLVSTFTSTLDVLEVFCRKNRYPSVRLDGQTKQEDRLNIVNTFNRSPVRSSFVFLLSTRAGGVGLNLIGANRLFLLEPEWNPALDQQAMARIHRDGQQKHCFIYRMMLSGTMDEKIFQRQITKLGLSDTLMKSTSNKDRGSKGGVGEGGKKKSKGGDSFTQEELKDIFTLHENTPCLCHDLLICTCGGKGVLLSGGDHGLDGVDDEEGSEEESPPPPSFIPASVQQVTREAQLAREARSRLAGLADWRHVDLTNPSRFTPLNDEVLNAVVAAQKPMLGTSATILNHDQFDDDGYGEDDEVNVRRSPNHSKDTVDTVRKDKSLLDLIDLEAIEESIASDHRAASALQRKSSRESGPTFRPSTAGRSEDWNVNLFEGGTVLYAFSKTSGSPPESREETVDVEEEEEVVVAAGGDDRRGVGTILEEVEDEADFEGRKERVKSDEKAPAAERTGEVSDGKDEVEEYDDDDELAMALFDEEEE